MGEIVKPSIYLTQVLFSKSSIYYQLSLEVYIYIILWLNAA